MTAKAGHSDENLLELIASKERELEAQVAQAREQARQLLESAQANEQIAEEINARVNAERGFRVWERIFRFTLLGKHFESGVELSAKLEMKRNVIAEKYAKEIAEILVVSPKTVEWYKARLATKLDIHNRTDLIRFAIRKSIITL